MTPSQKIRQVLLILGYNDKEDGVSVIPVLMLVVSAMLCANISCFVDHSAHETTGDSETRKLNLVIALKDLNLILSFSAFVLDYIFSKGNVQILLSMLDKTFLSYSSSKRHKELITKSKKDQDDTLYYIGITSSIACSVLVFLPGILASSSVFKNGLKNTVISRLPLPITFMQPETHNNIVTYILFYLSLAAYHVYFFSFSYCALVLISTASQSVTTDMKLFCLKLERIDKVLGKSAGRYFLTLRNYSHHLARSHQEIQKSVRSVTVCGSWSVSVFNQTICFHICVFLYCAAEVNNKLVQAFSCVCTLTCSITLLIYCYIGQRLINEGEQIRACLYECAWLDKPLWFQNHLRLMMAMANVPLQIKPFGLYVLDYHNFINITNAGYSYFNLLRTLKK